MIKSEIIVDIPIKELAITVSKESIQEVAISTFCNAIDIISDSFYLYIDSRIIHIISEDKITNIDIHFADSL